MAYSLIEDNHLKDAKYHHYYPEESDFTDYYDYPMAFQNFKKSQKDLPKLNYINERKSPIYVHQYTKTPSSSTYKSLAKTSSNSTSKNSPSSRSMLDRLEETYWASWRPSKETSRSKSPKKDRGRTNKSKNKAYGDASETFVKYFATTDFNTSSASVGDQSDRYTSLNESDNEYNRLFEMNSQEIQTEEVLEEIEEEEKTPEPQETTEDPETEDKTQVPKQETIEEEEEEEEDDIVPVKDAGNKEEPETNDAAKSSNSKILQHTDSFILTKKKQNEVKETYQQPKCIKLYRKPGTSFIRGGTYPLKSCLKKEAPPKGNFRLGPPGSPLFVTSHSFNKKFSR